MTTRFEADATRVRTDLWDAQACLVDVEQEVKASSERLEEVRQQSVKSNKVAEKTSQQLKELSHQVQPLETKNIYTRSWFGKFGKARDVAVSSAKEKGQQARMLIFQINLLKNELDLPKGKETTGCDMQIVGRKVADAKCKVNNLVDGWRRDTPESYASFRRNADLSLLAVGSRFSDLIDREAQELL